MVSCMKPLQILKPKTQMEVNTMSKSNTSGPTDRNTIMFRERKRLLFFGLPWTFTKYTITPNLLTVNQGLLNTTEDDCYMYKIQDVRLNRSLFERIFGLSTLICYTGDVTSPELKLIHIRNASDIKAYILVAAEEARKRRRTLNTQDIGVHSADFDGDGVPDTFD